MRTQYLRWVICAALLVALIDSSFAQTKPRTKTTRTKPAPSAYGNTPQNAAPKSAYGNNADTTGKPANQPAVGSAYGNTGNSSKPSIDTTLPIEVIKSSGNGLLDSIKISP